VDGGPTRLLSPIFDLSRGDGEISFYYWYYNSYITDPFSFGHDPFTVEVSNDGGATWTPVMELDVDFFWRRRSFRASHFLPPTSEMRVRFSVTDDPADETLTEAAVDDFEVKEIDTHPEFWADTYEMETERRGTAALRFQGGSTHCGRHYIILGSTLGRVPGTELGAFLLPLNVDFLTFHLLGRPNSAAFRDFQGVLDGNASCEAIFDTMGPVPAGMEGLTLTFALVVTDQDGAPPILAVSNPLTVRFF